MNEFLEKKIKIISMQEIYSEMIKKISDHRKLKYKDQILENNILFVGK